MAARPPQIPPLSDSFLKYYKDRDMWPSVNMCQTQSAICNLQSAIALLPPQRRGEVPLPERRPCRVDGGDVVEDLQAAQPLEDADAVERVGVGGDAGAGEQVRPGGVPAGGVVGAHDPAPPR